MAVKRKVNWKHIIIHLVAIWLSQRAGTHAGFLTDVPFLQGLHNSGEQWEGYVQGVSGSRLYELLRMVAYSGAAAMLIGFILSLIISVRRKWFWVNSLLSLVLLIVLSIVTGKLDFYPLQFLITSMNAFNSVLLYHSIFVFFSLTIAFVLFFHHAINRWIRKNYEADQRDFTFQFDEFS